ncbi:ankyrin repeat domain-containing protein [Halorhodospira sp. 9621]|uniref:ankyrin repeat domain-containing protein n=1 Tax=unclassified Halorhodospira TaxID=2626748 RepID=UPI001EE822B3|nr:MULTISPECIES: ankyrin repeat domain-containing protein [unclassified Halorhodospira]MCG5532716.1 ankyrin repeat domain-containing protein [Halorhodospira sp. 9621]MCG5537762.1 ankyrin repeat domain-containing protein [Halorhodospira sp. 9622]
MLGPALRVLVPLATGCLLGGLLAACGAWPLSPAQQEAFNAARDGDAATLERALDGAADVQATDGSGRGLLHYAALNGEAGVVELLIERSDGADLELRDDGGRVPLHEAAAGGHTEAVAALLSAGVAVDPVDGDRRTPLMLAARSGDPRTVEALLAAGAEPDRQDADGATALSMASAARYPRVAAQLREVSERPAAPWALIGVVRAGDVETLAWMLDRGLPVDLAWQDGDDFLSLADIAAESSPRAAALLLRRGAQLHGDGTAALVAAALHGDADQVAELLGEGVDPDVTVRGGDAEGRTLLMEAARLGYDEVVADLLAAGADASAVDEHGADALWHAAVGYVSPGDEQAGLERDADRGTVVRTLLEAGVAPSSGDRHDFAAIHAAAARAEAKTVEALLDAGAGLEQTDRNGRTPLIFAAQAGNEATLAALLARGADPRAVDALGATALTHARLAESRGMAEEAVTAVREAGGGKAVGPRQGTPGLSVGGDHQRLMRLDAPVAIFDSAGYDGHSARFLPYTTACRGHGCLVPPVVVLPAGTTVELVAREAAEDGRLHGVFLVQEPGLRGLLFEDYLFGAWPPDGTAVSEISVGRVAHIRGMDWVEIFDVDLPAATGGLFW